MSNRLEGMSEVKAPHEWKWTPPSNTDAGAESEILSIYYVYVIEKTPPIYRLYIQTRNGTLEPISKQHEKYYKLDGDRRAIMMAKSMRQEIPAAVPAPVKRERGPSCSIC